MSVVAADGHPILLDGPGTVVAIIFIIRILSHILKGRNHFECRSRRILALCSTIQKHAVLISIQEIPILSYGIGIKVRLGDHGQDLSGIRIHGDRQRLFGFIAFHQIAHLPLHDVLYV